MVSLRGVRRLVGLAGHDLRPQRGIGGEYAMEANEMEPGTRDEGGQALMAAGISTKLWKMEDIITLIDSGEVPKKHGPYKKRDSN